MLFFKTITNLEDWSGVFQEKTLFLPLAQEIFRQCGLPFSGLEGCTPGSNAVFEAGAYILKIFAPEEAGLGSRPSFLAEQYGLQRAKMLGVPAPHIAASGTLEDRYTFHWLLLERIEGALLADAAHRLMPEQWCHLGIQLRRCVERMDTPCAGFSGKPLGDAASEKRWELFPHSFRQQRKVFLEQHEVSAVFVHGDLNADNLMVTPSGQLVLIDFGDCRTAPFCTELAALVCDGLRFDGAFLQAFTRGYDRTWMIEQLVEGLLLHDYGAWIIRDRLGATQTFTTLERLKAALERSLICCLNR